MSATENFVGAVFREIFDQGVPRYRKSLSSSPDDGSDVYARARNALTKLSDNEREDVLSFISLAMADAVSIVFGTLDGTHFPDGISGDFVVSCDGDEISGDLQDYFLEKAEEKGIY